MSSGVGKGEMFRKVFPELASVSQGETLKFDEKKKRISKVAFRSLQITGEVFSEKTAKKNNDRTFNLMQNLGLLLQGQTNDNRRAYKLAQQDSQARAVFKKIKGNKMNWEEKAALVRDIDEFNKTQLGDVMDIKAYNALWDLETQDMIATHTKFDERVNQLGMVHDAVGQVCVGQFNDNLNLNAIGQDFSRQAVNPIYQVRNQDGNLLANPFGIGEGQVAVQNFANLTQEQKGTHLLYAKFTNVLEGMMKGLNLTAGDPPQLNAQANQILTKWQEAFASIDPKQEGPLINCMKDLLNKLAGEEQEGVAQDLPGAAAQNVIRNHDGPLSGSVDTDRKVAKALHPLIQNSVTNACTQIARITRGKSDDASLLRLLGGEYRAVKFTFNQDTGDVGLETKGVLVNPDSEVLDDERFGVKYKVVVTTTMNYQQDNDENWSWELDGIRVRIESAGDDNEADPKNRGEIDQLHWMITRAGYLVERGVCDRIISPPASEVPPPTAFLPPLVGD